MKNANLKTFELLSPKYERDNIKLGLSRIKKALQELGNPCKNIPAIQIIGTNGKGSIAAYLESILFEAKRNFGVRHLLIFWMYARGLELIKKILIKLILKKSIDK